MKTQTDNRPIYDFYTYNPLGHSEIVPIRAETEEDAWEFFDRFYGHDRDVDQVILRK